MIFPVIEEERCQLEFDAYKDQRNRESSSCECSAHMRITLRRSFKIFAEEWHVTRFVKDHGMNFFHIRKYAFCLVIGSSILKMKEFLLYKDAGLQV